MGTVALRRKQVHEDGFLPIMHSFYHWPFTHMTHLGMIFLIPLLADGAGKIHLRTIKRGKTACWEEKNFFPKAAD